VFAGGFRGRPLLEEEGFVEGFAEGLNQQQTRQRRCPLDVVENDQAQHAAHQAVGKRHQDRGEHRVLGD